MQVGFVISTDVGCSLGERITDPVTAHIVVESRSAIGSAGVDGDRIVKVAIDQQSLPRLVVDYRSGTGRIEAGKK